MRQVFLFISTLFFVLGVHAQTSVNQDGSIKFRGNVAIYVDSKYYTFRNGQAVKVVDNETSALLKTALRAIVMEKFQNISYGIVNRDDEATKQVEELIEENKLEDYLDGISVRAKNQGADYLCLVKAIVYEENNAATQIEISTKLMDVQNNFGYHSFYRSDAIPLNDEDRMSREVAKMVKEFSLSLENNLSDIFPEQFFISKTNGKDLTLGAYQPNGRIMSTDKFYIFSFKKDNLQIGTSVAPIQVLNQVAIGQNPTAKNGQLIVKSDKQVSTSSCTAIFKNVAQPIFKGTNQLTMTFFGLDDNDETFDGLVKGRINNAMSDAITKHVGLQLIEHDQLISLKKERELQKGEDFIDGHTVEQMKSIGAQYLLKLEDYQRDGAQVHMKISLISVEQNKILRTIDVVSAIDNIENEMYKQLCERITYPCVVRMVGKDKIEVTSTLSFTSKDNCILELTKAFQNPITQEVSYNRVDVCSLKFDTYMGNKCTMSIDKVISKEDLSDIEANSLKGLVTIRVNGANVESIVGSKTEVQQKVEKEGKKQKVKETLSNFRKAILGK